MFPSDSTMILRVAFLLACVLYVYLESLEAKAVLSKSKLEESNDAKKNLHELLVRIEKDEATSDQVDDASQAKNRVPNGVWGKRSAEHALPSGVWGKRDVAVPNGLWGDVAQKNGAAVDDATTSADEENRNPPGLWGKRSASELTGLRKDLGSDVEKKDSARDGNPPGLWGKRSATLSNGALHGASDGASNGASQGDTTDAVTLHDEKSGNPPGLWGRDALQVGVDRLLPARLWMEHFQHGKGKDEQTEDLIDV